MEVRRPVRGVSKTNHSGQFTDRGTNLERRASSPTATGRTKTASRLRRPKLGRSGASQKRSNNSSRKSGAAPAPPSKKYQVLSRKKTQNNVHQVLQQDPTIIVYYCPQQNTTRVQVRPREKPLACTIATEPSLTQCLRRIILVRRAS